VRILFRLLLIFVAIYLLVRSLSSLLRPRKSGDEIKGPPLAGKSRIDENRIQDANFKDLPKE
jgi:hypothetical protein